MEKTVLIIAKYADPTSLEIMGCSADSFTLDESIYDTFTGKELMIKPYYEETESIQSNLDLQKARSLNPTVGYDLVKVKLS